MDDDKSTTTSPEDQEDTSAEDTSTNDESQETDDTPLEDDESTWDDGDDDTDGDDEEGDDSAQTPDEDSSAEDEPEQPKKDDSEAEKESGQQDKPDPKEQARLAYEQRQAEKQARLEREQAKREAQAKYLQDAEDERELALRQLQIDAYNNRIENNTAKLQNSLETAVNSIPLFKDGTPAVQERLLKAVDTWEAMNVRKDRNGDPIEVHGNLVEYLKEEAASIEEMLGDGARIQSQKKSNQKSRTLTPPTKAPKKTKVDPDVEAFDEEANRW